MTFTPQEALALPLGERDGIPPKRAPREWGIELIPIGGSDPHSNDPDAVRVRLIDRETGRHVGARTMPWSWFRDVARTSILVNIAEGVHE